MAKSPNWTKEELKILSEVYPINGCTSELLSLLPGRTAKAINVKCSKIGLKVLNAWNKKKTNAKYTEELVGRNIVTIEDYVDDKTKIGHKCLDCGHEWSTNPHNVLAGHGCPVCNKGFGSMYTTNKQYPAVAYLYVTKYELHNGELFIKVGVSSNPTLRRLKDIKTSIGANNIRECKNIIILSGKGKDIFFAEQKILASKTLRKHCSSIKFSGSTELFNVSECENILNELSIFGFEKYNLL